MKATIRTAVAVGTLATVVGVGAALSADTKDAVLVDSATAKYQELAPGASSAPLWGDPGNGPHSAFTKFAPGFHHALHTHTNDLRIVVVKGAYAYKPENGEEKRVTAGQYLFIPGDARHATGSDATEGAIFYQEADGKFDINLVE